MKDYRSLMPESAQHRIDTGSKFGTAIAEVCLFSPLIFTSYILQMDPFAKLGFELIKAILDVNTFLEYPLVIFHLHSWHLAVKRAT
jgi:hypothetical protein